MQRRRKASDSGGRTNTGSPPEAIKPFLDVLAEILAGAVLRDLRTGAVVPPNPKTDQIPSPATRLQSTVEDSVT